MSVMIPPEEWERHNRGALDMIAHKVSKIDVLVEATRKLEEQQSRLEMSVAKMADAITRLALVEERQATTSTALERLGDAMEKLDDRLRKLEISEPLQARSSEWVMNAVWAAAAAAVMFIAGKAGLF